jgi:hypothetical protein
MTAVGGRDEIKGGNSGAGSSKAGFQHPGSATADGAEQAVLTVLPQ